MPEIVMFNQEGKQLKKITLDATVFGIEPNQQALFDVVKAQRAAMRQGTHKVKHRGEVAGGGRKPWRQKGTGRARQGSIRSPQWKGGGVVFGPTPRDYSFKVNRKVRRLALRSALSLKVSENAVKILDTLSLSETKTKLMIQILNNLSMTKKTLLILDELNENVLLSSRNIPNLEVLTADQVSVYSLMLAKDVIITESATKYFEEGLK
jgi:large subunit ribosomal protein L4